MSGIVGDCHTLLLSACTDNIISQSLRRTLYNILVHTVRAGTDNTAQSGCTKLKRRIKTLPNLFIIILNRFQLRSRPLVEIRIIQPFLICFSIVFHYCPSCIVLSAPARITIIRCKRPADMVIIP